MTVKRISKLGDIAKYLRGINFKPDDVVPVGTAGAVACMRTKNIQESLDCSDVWGVSEEFVRRPEQILQEGDLLVSSANSWNLVGKCCWIPNLPWKTTFGGFVSALRADKTQVHPRYLYWWFSSDRTQALLRSFGRKTTSISNLSAEQCLNLDVPLPSLLEQRRIAAILDQADVLRAKRRKALAQLDNLKQSIFIEMFGDPAKNPNKFPAHPLGAICDVRDGTHDSPKYVSSGFPLVTTKNLRDGVIDFTDVNLISEADYSAINKRSKVDRGDLLMPMIGTIGSPILVCIEPNFAIKNMALIKFTEHSPHRQFILSFLKSDAFEKMVNSESKGGTQKFLSLGAIRSLKIPMPPVALQSIFAARIQSVEALKATYSTALQESTQLFESLQHSAFRGEL